MSVSKTVKPAQSVQRCRFSPEADVGGWAGAEISCRHWHSHETSEILSWCIIVAYIVYCEFGQCVIISKSLPFHDTPQHQVEVDFHARWRPKISEKKRQRECTQLAMANVVLYIVIQYMHVLCKTLVDLCNIIDVSLPSLQIIRAFLWWHPR